MKVSVQVLGDNHAMMQLTEAMEEALTPEGLRSIAEAGALVVADKASDIVRTTAKHPTGMLAGAIAHRTWHHAEGTGSFLGWEQKTVKRSHGVGGRHSYRDGKGRGRAVDTVDDYARILEYSQRRQLRHMEPAWEQSAEEAVDRMESRLNELLEQAGF